MNKEPSTSEPQIHVEGQKLLEVIKEQLPKLQSLLEEVESHWHAEDAFYRFYHGSFKVYGLQCDTERIVKALRELQPERDLDSTFLLIIEEGTGKEWNVEHNARWNQETRPILEAFFHARMMLGLAVSYGRKLEHAPNCLPSGWAALLYLYDLR